jgi:hypothetical protein
LFRSLRRQLHQGETIRFFNQTIFNCNSSHMLPIYPTIEIFQGGGRPNTRFTKQLSLA